MKKDRSKQSIQSLALSAAAALSLSAGAAEDIVMKLTDANGVPFKGDSTIQGYKEQIDVIAWGWNLSNDVTFAQVASGGVVSANPVYYPIRLSKQIDAASDDIYRSIISGGEVKAEITSLVSFKLSAFAKTIVKLDGAVITSSAMEAAEDGITEEITLVFSKFCIKNNRIDGDQFTEGPEVCHEIAQP